MPIGNGDAQIRGLSLAEREGLEQSSAGKGKPSKPCPSSPATTRHHQPFRRRASFGLSRGPGGLGARGWVGLQGQAWGQGAVPELLQVTTRYVANSSLCFSPPGRPPPSLDDAHPIPGGLREPRACHQGPLQHGGDGQHPGRHRHHHHGQLAACHEPRHRRQPHPCLLLHPGGRGGGAGGLHCLQKVENQARAVGLGWKRRELNRGEQPVPTPAGGPAFGAVTDSAAK